jgi:hypothetical protein
VSAVIENAQELKRLKSQLAAARGDLNAADQEAKIAQSKAALARATVTSLERKVIELEAANAKGPDVVVSEHAILRYLERVHKMDPGMVRDAILEGGAAESIKFAKNGKIKRGNMTIVFSNCVVTTIKVDA